MTVRVLLADADALQREGWRLVVDAQPDLEVVAEAADGVEALGALRRIPVDVAVLDVRMPRASGLQLVEQVRTDARVRVAQRAQGPRTVLVTATDLDRYAAAGRAAGAEAVLYKDADPEALLAAVRGAVRVLSPGTAPGG